jgi:molybdenum cofactor guanylyltransferase
VPTARRFDAVILAGGAARRLGGRDKPGLEVGGATLLQRAAAAADGADRLIVVGPNRQAPVAHYVREDPPGAGPLPALAAGLGPVEAPWFALLAGDMPFLATAHVQMLRLAAMEPGRDGAVLVDERGRPQWLAGVWGTERVRSALVGHTGHSLRGLLGELNHAVVPAPDGAAFDCDTPEDLACARTKAGD